MTEKRVCGHEWEPISGWDGRYECIWCHAKGYKAVVQGEHAGINANRIYVYVCRHAGCRAPATVKTRTRQVCREHS